MCKSRFKQGGGYLNPTFCQHQELVYNISPHLQVQIQTGGGYLNPLQVQTLHCVLRLGKSRIQITPPPLFESYPWGGGKYCTLTPDANSWCGSKMLDSNTPPPRLNPDLHIQIYTMVIVLSALRYSHWVPLMPRALKGNVTIFLPFFLVVDLDRTEVRLLLLCSRFSCVMKTQQL